MKIREAPSFTTEAAFGLAGSKAAGSKQYLENVGGTNGFTLVLQLMMRSCVQHLLNKAFIQLQSLWRALSDF
jgi:hypothetical protein